MYPLCELFFLGISDTGFGPLIPPTGPAASRAAKTRAASPPPPAPPVPVSDEDFPALAPAPAPVLASATPATPHKTPAKKEKEKDTYKEKEMEKEKPLPFPAQQKKAAKKAAAAAVSPAPAAVPTPAAEDVPVKASSSSFLEPEAASRRQGPLMMRILSKDSSASGSSSALPTPKADSVVHFSDTASAGSSESRSVSPPPGLGSCAGKKPPLSMGPALADVPLVVTKTKSAIKKEKAEVRKREIEAAELLRTSQQEPMVAPIIGRAKKTKKAGKKATASSTPTTASTPEPSISTAVTNTEPPASAATPIAEYQEQVVEDKDKSTPVTSPLPSTQELPPLQPTTASQQEFKTPAQLLSTLDMDFSFYEMFKSPLTSLKWESYLTADEVSRIRSSIPEKVEINTFVSPGGAVLRGLTPAQEQRYVELEKRNRFVVPVFPEEAETVDLESADVKELERMLLANRKESEAFEKRVEKLVRRNRKILGLA
ncbi:hypothetical protein FN846DRAFT_893012 [Sphaerosporella brunnea]|uniref:Uncharacterized protein n=1 Tax=Sphaerosporella brunnea TaxID=1250544 RepID=A0A5J5ENU7_9PEZI|nr:hypothetical protein FN846DRAFT_893012 [Sphaerosporella brunnea]